jgi:dienelactone hydrolase
MNKILLFIFLIVSFVDASNKKVIEFKSLDNLLITADLYMIDDDINRPFIILYHQAKSSRGEYNEIAIRLNTLGYNCMSVDLRAGDSSNNIKNETYLRAHKSNKKTSQLKARIDIISALHYARQYSNNLIAWGSSYSASLILKTIGEKPRYAKAILAFSPGEYFSTVGKPDDYIRNSAKKIKIPVFITSAKNEVKNWQEIYNVINQEHRIAFIPKSKGNHGSSALWSKYPSSSEYWVAVEKFLKSLKQ